MRGSDFLTVHANDSLNTWERAITDNAVSLSVPWPLFPVATSANGHMGIFYVTGDVFSVGDPADYLRMPLTPIAAQKVADAQGMLLPTPLMAKRIWEAAEIKLNPIPSTQLDAPLNVNRGADLAQYAAHSQAIDDQLLAGHQGELPFGLVSGQKKDIVIGPLVKPGKVVIFGWFRPDGTNIQPRTNIHGAGYVDYSHGVRLVSPIMSVDGQNMNLSDVLASPTLSPLLSDEGPVVPTKQRYPATMSVYDRGSQALMDLFLPLPA